MSYILINLYYQKELKMNPDKPLSNDEYGEFLRSEYRKYLEKLNDAYFSYIKHLISLSTLILSLTVSFQSNLKDTTYFHRLLLQSSWVALAISIVCGLFALYAEVKLYGRILPRTATALEMLERHGVQKTAIAEISPIHRIAFRMAAILFGLGVILLMLFAVTTI